jgi:hypothetical protein
MTCILGTTGRAALRDYCDDPGPQRLHEVCRRSPGLVGALAAFMDPARNVSLLLIRGLPGEHRSGAPASKASRPPQGMDPRTMQVIDLCAMLIDAIRDASSTAQPASTAPRPGHPAGAPVSLGEVDPCSNRQRGFSGPRSGYGCLVGGWRRRRSAPSLVRGWPGLAGGSAGRYRADAAPAGVRGPVHPRTECTDALSCVLAVGLWRPVLFGATVHAEGGNGAGRSARSPRD